MSDGAGGVTRWWWIRHAPVTSYGGRIYGQTDVPADTSDAACYPALVRALPKRAVLVTTHLQRTAQTAEALRAAGLAIAETEVSRELAEQHFGDWQGRDRAEIFAEFGADHGFWLAPADHAPPGGESFAAMMERVAGAIDALTARHAGRDIVAVAHGGTIRAALGHALGLAPARAIGFVVDNCSLTRLDHIRSEPTQSDGPQSGGPQSRELGAAWRIERVNSTPWR